MGTHNDIVEKLKNAIHFYTNSESFYWCPLREITCGFSAVAYDVNALYEDDRVDDLAAIIKYCNIRFVTMVQMDYETISFTGKDLAECAGKILPGKYRI